jgi:hypothetical protein
MNNRERMEASENPATPFVGNGTPPLKRIDPDRVNRLIRDGIESPGLNRLQVMVGTILPRLEGRERG